MAMIPSRFRPTVERGRQAARAGLTTAACPYRINPHGCNRRNGGTWGAVWRSYWLKGFYAEHDRNNLIKP
jgi:hypothetical protein